MDYHWGPDRRRMRGGIHRDDETEFIIAPLLQGVDEWSVMYEESTSEINRNSIKMDNVRNVSEEKGNIT